MHVGALATVNLANALQMVSAPLILPVNSYMSPTGKPSTLHLQTKGLLPSLYPLFDIE